MTDASMEGAAAPRKGSSIHEIDARTRKRNASEKRFKAYGITAILIGLFFLVVLAVSIVRSGAPAFTKTVVDVEFTLSQAEYEEAESTLFKTKAYSDLFVAQLRDTLRDDGVEAALHHELL